MNEFVTDLWILLIELTLLLSYKFCLGLQFNLLQFIILESLKLMRLNLFLHGIWYLLPAFSLKWWLQFLLIIIKQVLFSYEMRIDTLREFLQQRIMVSNLHNLTLLHDYDLISILDCWQSVSNHDSSDWPSKLLLNLLNWSLDFLLIFLIQSTGGFIKEKNFRFLYESSCNC